MEIDGFGGENPMVMEAIFHCFSISCALCLLLVAADVGFVFYCFGELSIPSFPWDY